MPNADSSASSHCSVARFIKLRAAGVGDVGDVLARQVPQQPGIDGAECQVARLGAAARVAARCRATSAASARRSSWPAAGRSARGTDPGRRRAHTRATSASVRVSCQTSALCTGRPVARSHSSVVSRWLVMPTAARSRGVRFASRNACSITASVLSRNLERIMLDPAGLRIDLPMLALRRGDGVAGAVEHDEAAAGGALVDGADVFAHVSPSCFRVGGVCMTWG